jgi:hypothetical protein
MVQVLCRERERERERERDREREELYKELFHNGGSHTGFAGFRDQNLRLLGF